MKYLGYFFLAYVIYIIYKGVYIPWIRRTTQYQNLAMEKTFYPLFGDVIQIRRNEAENKFRFYHFIENSISNAQVDVRLLQLGSLTKYDI